MTEFSEMKWHTGYPDPIRADRDARRYWLNVQESTASRPWLAVIRTSSGTLAAGHDYRIFQIIGPDSAAPANFVAAVLLVTALGRVAPGETLAAVL